MILLALLLLLSLLPAEYFLGGLALQSLVFGLAGSQRRAVVAVVVVDGVKVASVSRETSVAAAMDRWSAPGSRLCWRRVS